MAEQALVENKFSVRVMPTPTAIRGGCGFCLRVSMDDFEQVFAFLTAQGFSGLDAYKREEVNGITSYEKILH
jgi:hypothetical protein